MKTALFPLTLALLLAGCGKSCRRDRPYVPYAVGDAVAPGVAVAPDGASGTGNDGGDGRSSEGDLALFQEEPAQAPPEPVAEWTLDGLVLKAPEGQVFVQGLVRDFDGDGQRDAFAILRKEPAAAPSGTKRGLDALAALKKEGPRDAGTVFYFRGQGGALAEGVPVAAPRGLEVPEGCAPTSRLSRVGARSVYAELGFSCQTVPTSPPSRWVAMVQGGSSPKTLISADVADPPGEPILFIEGASADFDHDGIDDVAFRFTLESSRPPFESGPKVSAVFRWFDRPAGLSRDPEAPDTDLRALVSGVLSKAGRPKEAPGVIQLLQQVRALYSAICSEGGGPRLTGVPAVGTLSCGPSRALEEGGVAEVRAYATVGDPLRTIAAFDRLQRPPSPKTPAKSTEALHYVALAAPSSVAKEVKTLTVRPRLEKGRVPSWGSLAFDAEGRLLVRSVLGVVRVDPLSGEEQRADDVPAWPTEVVSPDGTLRWIEAYNPCHGPALHATVGPADGAAGDEIFDVALPVHWPIGMRCASAKGEPVAALPLAWGPKGLEAIVAGEPVLVATGFAQATPSRGLPEGPYGLGAPRSPDGQVVAVPTSQGVLVRGAKTRMYRGRDFDSGQELRDCAVSNDMTRVACVRAGRVVWGQWDPP